MSVDRPPGWYPLPNRQAEWVYWDGAEWQSAATWHAGAWVFGPRPEAPHPWKRLVGLWVLLSVVGVVAGTASWHPASQDSRGCPQDSTVMPATVGLWLAGVVIAMLGLGANVRWDRRFRDTGLRRRLPLIDVLLVLGALVLPWLVYVMGYNLCWT
jgi:hypothetical protein